MTSKYEELLYKGAPTILVEGQPLADYLLERYPTAVAFKRMSRQERRQLEDKGGQKLQQFLALVELGQLIVKSHPAIKGQAYSSQGLGKQMIDRFAGAESEQVCVAYTDVHNDIVEFATLFKGGQSECVLYPDQIFKLALRYSASGLVLIHNHPTGDIQPSHQDLAFARRLESGSHLLGLQMLDFIIVGCDDYYSWRENEK